jgi:hypothetical protein
MFPFLVIDAPKVKRDYAIYLRNAEKVEKI